MTEKRSRGQPKFEPTSDQRNQVKLMKGLGIDVCRLRRWLRRSSVVQTGRSPSTPPPAYIAAAIVGRRTTPVASAVNVNLLRRVALHEKLT